MDQFRKSTIGGKADVVQALRFPVVQIGSPPEAMTPGQVPGITAIPGLFTMPVRQKDNLDLMDTKTIRKPADITAGLGLDIAEDMAFRKFADSLMGSDNEALLRQQVLSYMQTHGFDTELRRILLGRTMRLYKLKGVAQGNAERIRRQARGVTPDKVPMKMDMQKGNSGMRYVLAKGGDSPKAEHGKRFHAKAGATTVKDACRKDMMDRAGVGFESKDIDDDRYPDGMVRDLVKELTDGGHLVSVGGKLKKPGDPVTVRPEIFRTSMAKG